MAPNNKIRMSLSCQTAPASAAMTRMTSNRPVNVPSAMVGASGCSDVRRDSDIRMEPPRAFRTKGSHALSQFNLTAMSRQGRKILTAKTAG